MSWLDELKEGDEVIVAGSRLHGALPEKPNLPEKYVACPKSPEEKSYNAFESLCASLFLSGKDLVVMLTAYADESYNHRTDKNANDPLIYTVGCWLAPVEQWKKYGKKAKAILRRVGLEDFHMNKFESRLDEYADWSGKKRVGVFRELDRLRKAHTIFGCAYSIDRDAFDEVTTPAFRRNFAKSAYGFTVFSCMDTLSGWCEHNGYTDEIIHYVFAHLQKQGSDLDAFFNRALQTPSLKKALKLSSAWTKSLAKECVQLQSADILAYEVNKQTVNMVLGGKREIRKSLQSMRLHSRGRFHAGYYGREQLIRMVSDFENVKLQSHFPNLYSI